MGIILSIGIPTYNRASHIERLIRYFFSEIDQDLSEVVEVIIADDKSPDDTKKILDSIKPCPKWLIITNNEKNLGSHGNMRKIINIAQGQYIWLPGDDDYLKKGTIRKLVNIIMQNSDLSYVYLSKLGINEKTHTISNRMKTHRVIYDQSYRLSKREIVGLLKDNFGDLKFQGSSVVNRSVALKCDEEIQIYTMDTQDDCYSLFRAIRALQSGNAYFVSEVSVLNGDEISWGEKAVKYLFVSDLEFVDGLQKYGLTQGDCKTIKNSILGLNYLGLLANKELRKKWVRLGKPGLKPLALLYALRSAIDWLLNKIKLSQHYHRVSVELADFGD